MNPVSSNEALAGLRARLEVIERELANFGPLLDEKERLEKAILAMEPIDNGGSVPVWRAAKKIFLTRNNRPMTVRQLTDALLVTGGKQRPDGVRVALSRKPDLFEKLADGRYQLRSSATPASTSPKGSAEPQNKPL